MIIFEEYLFSLGAELQSYRSGDYIFTEGKFSRYYFQIKKGTVKLNNNFEDGKEFVHGFPFEGHCIGETYLFTDIPYGINAVAVTDCEIIQLEKTVFQNTVAKNPQLLIKISGYTAARLHFRYMISSFLAISDPVVRVKRLLDHIKMYFGYHEKFSFNVPYTRLQISSLIGLRVETVIRIIKKMEEAGSIRIENGKIYY